MVEGTTSLEIILDAFGSLADCQARKEINIIWSQWSDPTVFLIEAQSLWARHPDWEFNKAVHAYVAKLCFDAEPTAIDRLPEIKTMQDIQAETVQWLWHPYIPFGKLTLLEGDPGVGKSWLSLAIATAVSLGHGLPGQTDLAYGAVLIASAEDGLKDTIKPRLTSMGADSSAIRAVDGLFTLDDTGFEYLENEILYHLPVFLILDPLVAYLSGDLDINKANQVRYATARLSKLADKYGIAILAVRHLTKGGSSKAIYRGLGSIDFTAAARSVLLAGEDPDSPQQRGFTHIKGNLAQLGEPVGYEIKGGSFYWLEHCELTTEKILRGNVENSSSSLREAKDFILEILADGTIPANEIFKEAENRELSSSTLNRAKRELGVLTSRAGEGGKRGGGKWLWRLPP